MTTNLVNDLNLIAHNGSQVKVYAVHSFLWINESNPLESYVTHRFVTLNDMQDEGYSDVNHPFDQAAYKRVEER